MKTPSKKEIEKVRKQLRDKTKQAIQKFGKPKVKEAIKAEILKLQLMQVFSTKGGILGTPSYERLQIAVEILTEILKELESEK